ncbi:MAG: carbon starvation protein A [Gemmataceae bacterium]|nr:carbon starvation protein A [Gemmataceae bacterium]
MLVAAVFWEDLGGRTALHAMPVLLFVLCILALAYRYYSAFLAAKLAALDDSKITPAHQFNDGQNYHPTNRWVLFGHHFAAISGAGPLIGPVLAIQYGYMPGLLWLVIGVCLAGAVQDMLVLAASVRRGGKSLAEIARAELGPWAGIISSAAILFIVVIALAGLGFVVVKALGGETIPFPKGTRIQLPAGEKITPDSVHSNASEAVYTFPSGCEFQFGKSAEPTRRDHSFHLVLPAAGRLPEIALQQVGGPIILPNGGAQYVPGSSWGVFTIACTIPIALFVGLYLYRFRKGKVVEASLIGAAGVLAATVAGNWIPGSPLEPWFSLGKGQTVMALCVYGFVASVLPVWLLLCPRDYISSFLKVGTIILLVAGVLVANPVLVHRPVEPVFSAGGPTFAGGLFPFVFICIMCGAISGFHSLVASGTTPKMINRETDIRMIGYGSMLMEGLVGIVALIAAASLDPKIYYEINIGLEQADKWKPQVDKLHQELGSAGGLEHLDLNTIENQVGGESLRGRTGGAVTLAVGMSLILSKPLNQLGIPFDHLMKYWYHFAIMFEALFILTTIDTGTRIARFLLQEMFGHVHPKFARTDWIPGALLSTFLITLAWGSLVYTGSIGTIWPMFGIANQLLAALALALVTTVMVHNGKGKFIWITIVPMAFVTTTTMTAGATMIRGWIQSLSGVNSFAELLPVALRLSMTIFVMSSILVLLIWAASRWIAVLSGLGDKKETPV